MRVVYYLIILPFSKLPSWVLYRISDVLYVVVYRLVGYRKQVVRTNIKNSFPELSQKTRLEIERTFYVHFCDLIIESLKAFTISKAEVRQRFVHRNPEIFEKYITSGQHVTLIGGHYGNWELLAVSVGMDVPHQPVALYTPLSNKYINEKIIKSRSKYGLWLRSYDQVKQLVKETTQSPVVVIFGSDQCPRLSQQPHWMEFLNQETGVQFGAEKFARDNNTPVIYGVIHRVKRGHYEMEYRLICDNPDELSHGEITTAHTKHLEKDIRNNPAFWLWTHKRWKRKKKDFDAVKNSVTVDKDITTVV